MTDLKIERLNESVPVTPELLLHQVLAQTDKIDSIVIGVQSKSGHYTVLYTDGLVKDLAMLARVIDQEVDDVIKEVKTYNPK